ncbi:MAG TPA: hypothetical protein VGG10_15245 [Rhizomicrobium sp.]|jgi:hypothetical protein
MIIGFTVCALMMVGVIWAALHPGRTITLPVDEWHCSHEHVVLVGKTLMSECDTFKRGTP